MKHPLGPPPKICSDSRWEMTLAPFGTFGVKKQPPKTAKHISGDTLMDICWKVDVQRAAAESIHAGVQMGTINCNAESHRNTMSRIVVISACSSYWDTFRLVNISPLFQLFGLPLARSQQKQGLSGGESWQQRVGFCSRC